MHFQREGIMLTQSGGCRYHGMGSLQAGFIFLRPCLAIAEHMAQMVEADEVLQFPYGAAEQTFFDWYFKLRAYALPLAFNALADRLEDNLTIGGAPVKVIHHTMEKPFSNRLSSFLHESLCIQL